jgi:hypothetical protein
MTTQSSPFMLQVHRRDTVVAFDVYHRVKSSSNAFRESSGRRPVTVDEASRDAAQYPSSSLPQ